MTITRIDGRYPFHNPWTAPIALIVPDDAVPSENRGKNGDLCLPFHVGGMQVIAGRAAPCTRLRDSPIGVCGKLATHEPAHRRLSLTLGCARSRLGGVLGFERVAPVRGATSQRF